MCYLTTLISWICIAMLLNTNHKNNDDLKTLFEKTNGKETVTYQEGIAYFEKLAAYFDQVHMLTYGKTDIGKPLHLVVVSENKNFNPVQIRSSGKRIILINNGIHPGEPDGVDASMMFVRDLVRDKKLQGLLSNSVIAIIPFYNIDGALNRGRYSRANQNGPAAYGFRGNYRNLDLNRDFIKNDSRNARAFSEIFQEWQPDVYIETHVSNGADYQYIMTLIPTQEDKLGGVLGNYLRKHMVPKLEERMKSKKFEMTPYVNAIAETPDSGIVQFLETPRYSTGYAALFNTLAFMTETHMLKPYNQRVKATYQFLLAAVQTVQEDDHLIGQLREEAKKQVKTQPEFTLEWKLNLNNYQKIHFKGYEAGYTESTFSGLKRLYYDKNKPYEKEIPYYNSYETKVKIRKPEAYIVPQAWEEVILRLKNNRVQMTKLSKDTVMALDCYYISDYKTVQVPYEGHYLHYSTQINKEKQSIQFYAGDYIIYTNQEVNRYIIETLEPQATDSFFNWNFFDSILQQKEGFSDYVFEEIAEQMLASNPLLKQQYESKKQTDAQFGSNHAAQLDFLYKKSPYYEKSYMRYPVFRIEDVSR
jgi:hypothetical protein